jgi:hypothetical protein
VYIRGGSRNVHTARNLSNNEHGNMRDNLTDFMTTYRQKFLEMWEMYFEISPGHAMTYTAVIKNFYFIPFFRLCQFLGIVGISVTGDKVVVVLDDEYAKRDDSLHENKFALIQQIIEAHWYGGIPFWSFWNGSTGCWAEWMTSVRHNVALYRLDPRLWRKLSTKFLWRSEESDSRKSG